MRPTLALVCWLLASCTCDRTRLTTYEMPDEIDAGFPVGGGEPESNGGGEAGGGSAAAGGTAEPSCGAEDPECSFVVGDAGTPAELEPWVKTFFARNSHGIDVVLDATGDVVIGGIIHESADFGAGQLTIPALHFYPFVLKYAPDGKLRWVRIFREHRGAIAGAGDVYNRMRMAVSADGTIFLAIASLVNQQRPEELDSDMSLVSLSPSGAVRWKQGYPAGHNYYVSALQLDPKGGLWIGGSEDAVASRTFVAKFSTETGNVLHHLQMQSTAPFSINTMAVLEDRSLIFGGGVSGTVHIDPATPLNSPDVGSYDAYLVKVSAQAVPIWSRRYGSLGGGQGVSILKSDGHGGAYLDGYFAGTLTGLGDLVATGAEEENHFLARVDGDGTTLWSRRIPGWRSIASHDLLLAGNEGVVVASQDVLEDERPTVTLQTFSPEGTPLSQRVFMDGAHLFALSRRGTALALSGVTNWQGSHFGVQPDPAGQRYFIAYFPR